MLFFLHDMDYYNGGMASEEQLHAPETHADAATGSDLLRLRVRFPDHELQSGVYGVLGRPVSRASARAAVG